MTARRLPSADASTLVGSVLLDPAPPAALITGSARRVGRVIAEHLIAQGWRVAIHATERSVAEAAAATAGATVGIGADLADGAACRQLVDDTLHAFDGRLDLLVNNASTFVSSRWGELTEDCLAAAFGVTLQAPVLILQHAAPALEYAHGLAVNIVDHAALDHWESHPAHAAAKSALISMTRSAARAYAPSLRVNAIAPGTILPPDDWSSERRAHEESLGRTHDVGDLCRSIDELVGDPRRTGEVLVLGRAA